MQFIKTICVVVVLGALAYGAYTTLTGKPKVEPPVETVNWDSPPRIELPGGGELKLDSNVALPTGPAGGAAPKYGTSTEASGTARIAPGGPLTGPALTPTAANPPAAAPAGTAAAVVPASYPSTNAVPGPFDGGGAVHLVSAPSISGAATPAASHGMPNALQPSSATPTLTTTNPAESIAKGQAFLAQNNYLQALDEFSKCFDHAALSPEDARRVQELLDQLAGTVIYSREHLIEPAYVVAQGESLQAIAEKHQVPMGLLAKINGITDPLYLPAGTQLKMVKGPFDAVVDKGHQRLSLFVDGMYAGSFPAGVAQDLPEGNCVVDKVAKNAVAPSGASSPAISLSGGIVMAGTNEVGAPGSGLVALSARDADDLCDILSVGSKVVVRK
ncbi:MAG: LysM peptidoglycan-binding domain-containing protein [Planctomycetia bacterium]|nr:LysM peptidoglycan-binding domain-containing protein [Planctomycetia bacterium]